MCYVHIVLRVCVCVIELSHETDWKSNIHPLPFIYTALLFPTLFSNEIPFFSIHW